MNPVKIIGFCILKVGIKINTFNYLAKGNLNGEGLRWLFLPLMGLPKEESRKNFS